MIPFFTFYSMLGCIAWATGVGGRRLQSRRVSPRATAGRTTLKETGPAPGSALARAGSGVPNLAAYDPAFAYEVAAIVRDGIRSMFGKEPEDIIF